jgi:FixJ family two-component response regulator
VVFVVDDDEAVRRSLQALIRLFHLPVECFASAQEFLAVFDGKRRGCLVLDVRLPGLSGVEMHNQLLDSGVRLPTIFITGHAVPPLGEEERKKGVVAVFQKPFRPQALIEVIRKVMTA